MLMNPVMPKPLPSPWTPYDLQPTDVKDLLKIHVVTHAGNAKCVRAASPQVDPGGCLHRVPGAVCPNLHEELLLHETIDTTTTLVPGTACRWWLVLVRRQCPCHHNHNFQISRHKFSRFNRSSVTPLPSTIGRKLYLRP